MLVLFIAAAMAAAPIDINGPPWALFGQDLASAHAQGEYATRIVAKGSGSCFSDRRKLVELSWTVEVCASNGTTIDQVRLMSSRDDESALLNVPSQKGRLNETQRRVREALETQYGPPVSSMDVDLVWKDQQGDGITVRQQTVAVERAGRYDAVVVTYSRKVEVPAAGAASGF